MASISIQQRIIEKLFSDYKIKGYVTEKSVFDTIIEHNLHLYEVDYICDQLLCKGVIIREALVENADDDEEDYDRSQTDYDKLFKQVVEIDVRLAPFIEEIHQIKPPQHREWKNLILQAKNNNNFARQRIIEMYLRVVIKIAYWHYQKYKVPLAESIQDGCVGLVIALDKYEIGEHGSFSTYASWWIRQKIIRDAPNLNPLIYIPVHIKDKLFNIYEMLEQHYCEYCDCDKVCSEIIEAVAEKLECSQGKAKEYLNYLNSFNSVEDLMEKDEFIFFDEGISEENILTYINKKDVVEVLKTLSYREEKVVSLRFGLADGIIRTLEQVGKELGVTRERIRQIEKKAINKLRHPSRSKKLK